MFDLVIEVLAIMVPVRPGPGQHATYAIHGVQTRSICPIGRGVGLLGLLQKLERIVPAFRGVRLLLAQEILRIHVDGS